MSVPLSQLPTSSSAPISQQDINLANHIFGDTQVSKSVSNYIKTPLLVSIIAGVMLHPFSDELVLKFYPKAEENKYTMMAVKMVIAALLFYIFNNWGLAKN
jgi:hypothetical protein